MSIGDELERRSQRGTVRGPDEVWLSTPVQAALRRKKIPLWAVPVIAFLPIWAVIWVGGLSEADSGEPDQLGLGASIYASSCSGCHGPSGQGASGPRLAGGEVVATFPDIADQLAFVHAGSKVTGPPGTPYGDPDRPGGGRSTFATPGRGMPGFGDTLTDAEILAVVRHEREVVSGVAVDPARIDGDGNLLWPNGEPMLDANGELVAPDGSALLEGPVAFATPSR